MAMPLFSRGGEGPSRQQELAAALAAPPRGTTWELVPGERLELRDGSGGLIAWMKAGRSLSGLRDAAGRLLVTFKPAVVRQVFSGANILQLGIEGAVFGDTVNARPGGPGPGSVPGVGLHDVSTGITFAQVGHGDGTHADLLPTGRLNERLLLRHLGPPEISRLRAASPLSYLTDQAGAGVLAGPAGRVAARIPGGLVQPGMTSPRPVEIGDNDLPGGWLFAILLACWRWPG
jgi:hypothetical protein